MSTGSVKVERSLPYTVDWYHTLSTGSVFTMPTGSVKVERLLSEQEVASSNRVILKKNAVKILSVKLESGTG